MHAMVLPLQCTLRKVSPHSWQAYLGCASEIETWTACCRRRQWRNHAFVTM